MVSYGKRGRVRFSRKKKYSRWGTYRRAGSQLYKDVMYLKGLLNVEYKNNDITFSAVAIPTTGTFTLLNGLAQGDDRVNRDGRSIRIKSIYCNATVRLHASATSSVVRCLIIVDKQCNGAAPALADIFSLNTVDGIRQIDNGKRFIVLMDKKITLNTDRPDYIIKYYKKISLKVKYDGTTAAIGDITTNSLHMLFLSDEAINTPDFTGGSRIRFIDN